MNFRIAIILSMLFCPIVIDISSAEASRRENQVPVASLSNSSFKDLWQAIIVEAGIDANFVTASRKERRAALVAGTLAMDCCSIPAWRATPAEQAVQLYTDPIFYATDHLILQEGRVYDIPDPVNLMAFRIAVVSGFNYVGGEFFGEVIEVPTMDDTYRLVASGRADLTIANSQEFWRRQRLTPLPLILGPVHDQVLLGARVHKNWAALLPQINAAIKRLRKSGRMDILMAKRIRDITPRPE